MSSTPTPRRYRISTGIATSVADKLHCRQAMMRSAFRDGLFNRHGFTERPALADATGLLLTIAGATPSVVKFGTEHAVSIPYMIGGGMVAAVGGSLLIMSKAVQRSLKLDADRIDKFFKKPNAAMHTALFNREIHDETDAHILGRGIKHMAVFLGQSIDSLQFDRDEMNAIEQQMMPQETLQQRRYEQLRLECEITSEAQLKVEMVRAFRLMRKAEDLAYLEGLMREAGPTGQHYRTHILEPIEQGLENLNLLDVARPAMNTARAATLQP